MRPRRTSMPAAAVTITAVLILSACGTQRTSPPAVSELLPTLAAGYTTVYQASGHGTRRFTGLHLPRHIQVLMTCRGGDRVAARYGSGDLTVACGPMVGANTTAIAPGSDLTLTAAPHTQWALLVATRNN